jgi:hypothetical protein
MSVAKPIIMPMAIPHMATPRATPHVAMPHMAIPTAAPKATPKTKP